MIINIYTSKNKHCFNKNSKFHNSYGVANIYALGHGQYCQNGKLLAEMFFDFEKGII